jgi:hypothetical protein
MEKNCNVRKKEKSKAKQGQVTAGGVHKTQM